MGLKTSYTLIAPFYDLILSRTTVGARKASLSSLADAAASDVLLLGVGTGLDLPLLPPQHRYTGIDLTAAMLTRAMPRAGTLRFAPLRGDAQQLPLADASFDAVILHLILAVVPQPERCLREAARVLRPGGQALIFDKFLRRGQGGWRRWLNPLTRHVATRTDVVFEDVLASCKDLATLTDRPALGSGWFRLIQLRKDAPPKPAAD